MKKLIAILLVLCMAVALFAACDGGNEAESGTDAVSIEQTDADATEPEKSSDPIESDTEKSSDPIESDTEDEASDGNGTTAEETAVPENTTANETVKVEETTEEETYDWSPYHEDAELVTKYPYTDSDGVIHLSFQDEYNLGKKLSSIENISITSYKTGTQELDDNVLTTQNKYTVYAAGCGTAKVTLENGDVVNFVVHPSPINLLFLTGQSNGAGDPPSESTFENGEYQKYFVRSEERMAYYVFTNQTLTVDNAKDYVPNNLVWETCFTNTLGCDPKALTNKTTGMNFKNYSICAGLAYEWTEQTGERVFIVNASHGGQPIHCFKPSEDGTVVDNDYYQAITIFNLALETMYREADAGHFTLNHMAYYWYQGEGDSANTADYYLDAFAEMHAAMMEDVVYSHNGVEKKLEYCGIMTVRSCKDSSGNSDLEYYITGPRLAQYTAANKLDGVLSNVFLASKVTEEWIGGDKNVEDYFMSTYVSKARFKSLFGYDMPVSMKTVKPEIHYRIFGQNEKGIDAARNSLQFLNFLYPERQYELSYRKSVKMPELTLVSRDGYTPVGDVLTFDAATLEAYLIPYITPVWRTVEGLSLKPVTEGIKADGFRLYITDKSLDEFTVEIILGEKRMDTRTFKIVLGSSFDENLPLYINYGTSKYPNRAFESYVGGWDAGLLTFANGSFTVYDKFNAETSCLNAGDKDGFNVANKMLISQAPNEGAGALGIRFKAEVSGKVKIGLDTFHANRADCFIAVFVNGEKVAPSNDKAPNNRGGWYLFSSADNGEKISEKWADIVLDIKEGDEIVFALTGKGEAPNATLHPYVEYISDNNK